MVYLFHIHKSNCLLALDSPSGEICHFSINSLDNNINSANVHWRMK